MFDFIIDTIIGLINTLTWYVLLPVCALVGAWYAASMFLAFAGAEFFETVMICGVLGAPFLSVEMIALTGLSLMFGAVIGALGSLAPFGTVVLLQHVFSKRDDCSEFRMNDESSVLLEPSGSIQSCHRKVKGGCKSFN